jgi:O-antigen/teichoic acid export membrane protein
MIIKLKYLFSNKGFLKYFKNTSWLLVEKLLRIFVGLFVGVWIARYLGPENFGILSYSQSFAAIFSVIATLGIDNLLVRELLNDQKKINIILGTSFWLKLLGSFLTLIFLYISLSFTNNDQQIKFFILIIGATTLFQSFNVFDFYFQSQVLSKYVVYANILSLIIISLLKITFIIQGRDLDVFVYLILFESILLAMSLAFFFFKNSNFKIQIPKFNKNIANLLIKDSWPLIFSGILISIYMKIDQVMIKEILGSKEVGEYAAAVKISEAWYFIPGLITSSLFPALMNAKKKDEDLYNKRIQGLYKLIIWISIIFIIPLVLLSDILIDFFYGDAYVEATNVLVIHIWSGIFVFLGLVSEKWLIIENLQKISLYNTAVGALINITLNFLLINKIGINGAAWATLASYAFSQYFMLLIWNKTRKIFFIQTKGFILINGFNIKNFN